MLEFRGPQFGVELVNRLVEELGRWCSRLESPRPIGYSMGGL